MRKKHVHVVIHFFSKSTKNTVGLLLLVALVGVGATMLLPHQTQESSQRIADAPTPTPTPPIVGAVIDNEELNFLNILNNHREGLGLQKLKASVQLTNAATWMTQDMAHENYLGHNDSLGRTFDVRITSFGYPFSGIVGENAARVGSTGNSAFAAWLSSTQGHKEMMENPTASVIGISRTKHDQDGVWYWIADFGSFLDAEATPGVNPTATGIPTQAPNPTATTIPDPSSSPTTRPTVGASDMAIALKVSLPGIGNSSTPGANGNPRNKTRTFTIELLDNKNEVIKQIDAPLTFTNGAYEGDVAITGVPAGRYTVKVQTHNSLLKALPGVIQLISGGTFLAQPITLVTGNLDVTEGSRNILDVLDYNILLIKYGSSNEEDLGFVDLNDDGAINSKDLNILLRGFATRRGD